MKQIKIISGGQTGVDRSAFDFALSHGVPCGGFCPKGRKAEDGQIPDLYPLTEITSEKYPDRTKKNIAASDGTMILYLRKMDAGTRLTKKICTESGKPLWIQDLSKPFDFTIFNDWCEKNTINTLNFAGPRESFSPGIFAKALQFIGDLFA